MAARPRPHRFERRLRRGIAAPARSRWWSAMRAGSIATARSIAASFRSRSWLGATSLPVEGVAGNKRCSHGALSPCHGKRVDTATQLARRAASHPASDGREFWVAVRLLHARIHHVTLRGLLPQRPQDCSATRRTTLRQSLPLHGYRPIRDAAADALTRRNGVDKFDEQLKTAKAKIGAARYVFAGEKFFRPTSLEKLFAAMAKNPGGQLIAGATELARISPRSSRSFRS